MQNIYSVAQVNLYIKNMFIQDFMMQSIMVRGEVSNCKYHSSGHIYFTLKDRSGTIACVMFAGSRSGLAFQMAVGQQVVVQGSIEVYERDGKYQLYAKKIQQDGIGNLHERFELLKKELEERGMFSEEYKQQIPPYIHTLGVVTAPTGAAVQDIINITRRRNPYVQIIVYPAVVQGEEAARSIANGIRVLEQVGVDVMIVGRGGGSMEDLWAFNEEIVAQAVFDSQVPIISAVGHETDTTIIDYVSDLRAPTPSAAAELAVYDIEAFAHMLYTYQQSLQHLLWRRTNEYVLRMKNYQTKLQYLSPSSQLHEKRNQAVQAEEKMRQLIVKKIDESTAKYEGLKESMLLGIQDKIQTKRHEMALYAERLRGVSPLDKLSQGYSFLTDEQGNSIKSVTRIKKDDTLVIYVTDGSINAKVTDITKKSFEK